MLDYIFMKVLFMSLAGGIVIAVTWLAASWKGLKISSTGRYYLWLCALLVMVLPIRIPNPIYSAPVPPPVNTPAATTAPEPIQQPAEFFSPAASENGGAIPPILAAAPKPSAVPAAAVPAPGAALDAKALALFPLFWAGIAALLILRYLVEKILLQRKITRFSIPVPQSTEAVFRAALAQSGIRRRVRIRGLRVPASPFVTGIFRNTVYVPDGLQEEELRLILRHELTHCRRFDLLYRTAAEIIGAIHFFNPLVYVLKQNMEKYCELSCDERAVEDMSSAEKKTYSMAMLNIAGRNMARFNTAAALCEKQTHLKERIESIMTNNTPRARTRALTALTVTLALLFSTVTSGVINAQNSTSVPKATYVSENFHNISITPFPEESQDFLNVFQNPVMTYTDFLGRNTFTFTFIGMPGDKAAQYRQLLEQGNGDAAAAMWDDLQNYTDYYAVELIKTQEKYGSYTKNIKGLFKITCNDTVWAENAEGFLTNLPPVTPGFDMSLSTELTVAFHRGEQQYLLHTRGRFEDLTSEQGVEERRIKSDFNRSRDTRTVYLGHVEKMICEGQPVDTAPLNGARQETTGTLEFNPTLGQARISVSFDRDRALSLFVPAPAKCTDDMVQAEFLFRKPMLPDNGDDSKLVQISSQPWITPYAAVQCTVSGLSNPIGGYVELKSEDGQFYYQAQIAAAPKDTLPCYGTRRPEEFYVQGEDVFIGTPAEQDDFDKDEHDKFYKRIVTDENGYVLFVVPVEYQTGPIVKDAEEQLRAHSGTYKIIRPTDNWQSLLSACLSDGATAVLLDPVTWWCYGVVPPENRYLTKKDGVQGDFIVLE